MARQLFLFKPKSVKREVAKTEIRVLAWNVANPSLERAKKQYQWISNTEANIIILTEIKNSLGGAFLRDALENIGFNVFAPKAKSKVYSVLIAEKGFYGSVYPLDIAFLPERIQGVKLKTFFGDLLLTGMYVPSRGPKERKNVDKRKFQDQIIKWLDSFNNNNLKDCLLIGGDLNVIPQDHEPSYPFYGDWEYLFYDAFLKLGLIDTYKFVNQNGQEHSWIGRSGDGYRFDHLFLSGKLSSYVNTCTFIHETRALKLSDHSALYLSLKDLSSAT